MPSAPNMPSNQMQPFDYDPKAYVGTATNWAQNWYDRGNNAYTWAQDQFTKNEGTADAVTKTALANSDMFDNAAKAGVSRYESLYGPAMQQQMQYAANYASPENLALLRGQAIAGVGQAFDQSADAAASALRSHGLDPATIGARLDIPVRMQRAAAQAAAGTSSDTNNRIIGQQLLTQAINTGQQDAGVTNQFGSMGAANRNQAVNTGLATTASGSATMGTPTQWSGMAGTELQEWPKTELQAMQASNQQGALWNDINKTNLAAQAQNYNQGSGWGSLIGAGLGIAGSIFGGPIGGAIGNVAGKAIGGMFGGGGGMMGGSSSSMSTPGSTWFARGGVAPTAQLGPRSAIQTGQMVPHGASVPGIQGPDKVPAMLQSGEGILPKRTMDHIGKKGLQAIIDKADRDMGLGPQHVGGQSKPMPRQAMQTGPTFASQGAMG